MKKQRIFLWTIQFGSILGGGILTAQNPVQPPIEVTAERRINSTFQEYSPAFFENGLVFIASNPDASRAKREDDRTGKFATSIFFAQRGADGSLEKPVPFSESLTTNLYEGPLTFDAAQQQVFFTRSKQRFGKPEPAPDGKVRLQIYGAQRKGEGWTKPTLLNLNEKDFDFAHPSISYDGSRLIFCANRQGGRGGTDLYMSLRSKNKKGETIWGEPVNLGMKVNTSGNEMFPHLHADGTLFFASTGHKGLGGLDIFFTRMTDTGWLAPQHLPTPINSRSDDFGLIADLDQKNGYFSSNRTGGEGDDDIYRFFAKDGLTTPPKPTFEATIFVAERDSRTPLARAVVSYALTAQTKNAAVLTDSTGNILSLKTSNGGELAVGQVAWKTDTTDADGIVKILMEEGQYIFNFEANGYAPRHIVKTMYRQDNRVLGQMEKIESVAKTNNNLENVGEKPKEDNKISEQKPTPTEPRPPTQAEIMADFEKQAKPIADNSKANPKVSDKKNDKKVDKKTDKKSDKKEEKKIEKPKVEAKVEPPKEVPAVANNPNSDFEEPIEIGISETKKKTENSAASMPPPVSVAVQRGTVIKLPNVYYNYNDADLRPEGRADLAVVVDLMKKYPNMTIEIQSHTDARASAGYNLQLSQRRADNILEHMVANGIVRERLTAVGYGESFPKNHCLDSVPCTEAEFRVNRRTEIKILQSDSALANAHFENADIAVRKRVNAPRPKNAVSSAEKTPPPSMEPRPNLKMPVLKFDTTLAKVNPNQDIWYMVVVGTYSKTDNAMRQLKRALEFGFIDAEIVDHPETHLKTVCLKRFKNKSDAETVARAVVEDQQFDVMLKVFQF